MAILTGGEVVHKLNIKAYGEIRSVILNSLYIWH